MWVDSTSKVDRFHRQSTITTTITRMLCMHYCDLITFFSEWYKIKVVANVNGGLKKFSSCLNSGAYPSLYHALALCVPRTKTMHFGKQHTKMCRKEEEGISTWTYWQDRLCKGEKENHSEQKWFGFWKVILNGKLFSIKFHVFPSCGPFFPSLLPLIILR